MLEKQAPPETQTSSPELADFTLKDRYTAEDGIVVMNGIQALARLPLDQHRADLTSAADCIRPARTSHQPGAPSVKSSHNRIRLRRSRPEAGSIGKLNRDCRNRTKAQMRKWEALLVGRCRDRQCCCWPSARWQGIAAMRPRGRCLSVRLSSCRQCCCLEAR